MAKKIHLVVIDPQYDFCDPKGALYVKGAEEDTKRVASFVRRCKRKLDDIHVTLDSHHLIDVGHPAMWRDSNGNPPPPFTAIAAKDIETGKWTPFKPSLRKRMHEYAMALEKGGRYPLMVWPPHCLIGTIGQTVVSDLSATLHEWCLSAGATVNYVTKGSNPYTEHYSAIQAEVPDPQDPTTQINTPFIKMLMDADEIAVAGEAGSHCLKFSVEDVLANFKDDKHAKKMVMLECGFSPVPGFEQAQEDFVKDMKKRGMRFEKIEEYLS